MLKSERGCRKQCLLVPNVPASNSSGYPFCQTILVGAATVKRVLRTRQRTVAGAALRFLQGRKARSKNRLSARECPKPHGTQKFLLRLRVPAERFSISAQIKSTPKTDAKSGLWRVSFVCFRACFKTIKVTKAKCRREKQPHESRRLSSRSA